MRITDIPKDEQILFVCEKQSQMRNIHRGVTLALPHHEFVSYLCFNSLSASRYVMPKDMKISSAPIVMDPLLTRKNENNLIFHVVEGKLKKFFNLNPIGPYLKSTKHIVFACDCDDRGAGMFRDLMMMEIGVDPLTRHFPALLRDMEDPETIRNAIMAGENTLNEGFRTMACSYEAKRFFTYNWAVNALMLFDHPAKESGNPENKFVSKYALLTLYHMREVEQEEIGNLMRWMRDNPGTGKYHDQYAHIGSPTSYDAIITSLVQQGYLSTEDGRKHEITENGRKFLSMLHPDCHDPDIAYRISQWGEDWPNSRPKMEKYIRTYFGKQKRYLSRIKES